MFGFSKCLKSLNNNPSLITKNEQTGHTKRFIQTVPHDTRVIKKSKY